MKTYKIKMVKEDANTYNVNHIDKTVYRMSTTDKDTSKTFDKSEVIHAMAIFLMYSQENEKLMVEHVK